ncbi:MAG: hydantoinase/oxoprolinase family protein [Pseudomonadota bacterium]|nr:hydantoinase/oxoprolinase family protein [Pseudomonadota bacterium]
MTEKIYSIGIDVGGTFTDIVRLNLRTGVLEAAKVPTDYSDPVASMMIGISRFGKQTENTASLRHATTLATNAVIEHRLTKGALLTTKGFRDVIDIGRIQRPEAGIYDFNIDTPEPMIPRALRLEVEERIGSKGEIVLPLDESALRSSLGSLRSYAIDSIAVSCLFSFINPVHERRISTIVAEELPGVFVSVSSDVSPEIREFERTSTVVIDAGLKPVMSPYLTNLEERMTDAGISSIRIMTASGGMTDCGLAASRPVNMVNSGPAAGVLASANLARTVGIEDSITIDMGGTSLDIGVVEGGHPVQKFEGEIAGYPLRIPMIDVSAVAAGGGSLAFVDKLGFVQVDHKSAGSVPGPACYGRGGTRPTITDADLILNRLSENVVDGGGLILDRGPAETAFETEICAHLVTDIGSAAAGVLEIIQARMVKAISAHTLEQGLDIRTLPLLVYGGAGPTHGVELAEAMGIRRVIIPYLAGNFSAVGLMLCPFRWDSAAMVMKNTDDLAAGDLAEIIGGLNEKTREIIAQSDIASDDLVTHWHAHMRYSGQSYDLPVETGVIWEGEIPDDTVSCLVDEFHLQHERRYAYRSDDETVEIVQLRVSVRGPEVEFPAPLAFESGSEPASEDTRDIYFTGSRKFLSATVWARQALISGNEIAGPAVVNGEGSSALIPPGWVANVDQHLNLDVWQRSKRSSELDDMVYK